MNINPLDVPGTMFEIELLNPNPSSSRKGYRVSFQVSEEVHSAFMAARESNLRLIGRLAVAHDNDDQSAHDAVNGKSKKERKPKEKTPHGDMWRFLHLDGFFNAPGVREAIEKVRGGNAYEDPHLLMRRVFGAESLSREIGPEEIYARFPRETYPQVYTMVEQAKRKAGEKQ